MTGTGITHDWLATPASAETDKPWYSDAYEVGRQVAAGAAVDLPRMAGQAARWMSAPGSPAEGWGREVVEAADARAEGWEPDMEGRGPVASTLIKGARAVAPMAPAIAASMAPGGQWIGPAVAATQFGASSAQDTEDKLRLQGISDEEATRAGWNTAVIQGPLEGVATAVGARAFTAARPLLGLGSKTTGSIAARATDTAVLKPLAKGMALNLVMQPATEVAQDVGTELNERAYGAAPEDMGQIAADSAQGGLGLALLLGPFAGAAQVRRAGRAQAMKDALFSPQTPETVRNQARDMIVAEAKRQNVAPGDMNAWLDQQFTEDDLRFSADQAERDEAAAPGIAAAENSRILSDRVAAARQAASQQQMASRWNDVPHTTSEWVDQVTGASRQPMPPTERAAYPREFEAAASAPAGIVVSGEDGHERELSAIEAAQLGMEAPRTPPEEAVAQVPRASTPIDRGILDRSFGLDRRPATGKTRDAYAKSFEAAAQEPSGAVANDEYGIERELSAIEALHRRNGLGDDAAVPAQSTQGANAAQGILDAQARAVAQAQAAAAPLPPEQARQVELRNTAKRVAQAEAARDTRAKSDYGITKPAALATYGELEQAHTDGLVDDEAFAIGAGALAGTATGLGKVRASLAALRKEQQVRQLQAEQEQRTKQADADQVAADAAKLRPKPATPPATVSVGRSGREVAITKEQLAAKLAAAPPLVKRRIADLFGMDITTDPDTGKPKFVTVANPRTLDEVAALEAARTGVQVKKQAIQQSLAAFGINSDVVGRMAAEEAPDSTYDSAELGIGATGGEGEPTTNGFRVEDSASKATGAGLVSGDTETLAQEEARKGADRLLKVAGPGNEVSTIEDEFAEKRRLLALEQMQRELEADLASPEGGAARTDWDDMKSDSAPAFDALPPGYKLSWIAQHKDLVNEHGTELEPFQRAQASLERDFVSSPENSASAQAQPGGRSTLGPDDAPGRGSGDARAGLPAPEVVTGRPNAAVQVTTRKKRTVVREAAAPAPAPAQEPRAEAPPKPAPAAPDMAWAEELAADVGGTVVPVSPDTALVRGFSSMSGALVYSAAKRGIGRTRVDITSYTGTAFTAAEKRDLLAAREGEVQADVEAFNANPDGPFAGATTNVVASASVDARLAGYLTDLMSSMGLTNRVFLVASTDAKAADAKSNYGLNGRWASAMSPGLTADEPGSIRQFPREGEGPLDFYIAFNPKLGHTAQLEVVGHELGHLIEKVAFAGAPAATKGAITAEFNEWRRGASNRTRAEQVESMRNRRSAEAMVSRGGLAGDASSMTPYWHSFSEWFADNVSRWTTTADKPLTLVEKFFSRLGVALRRLAGKVTGKSYAPSTEVRKFLDAMGPSNFSDSSTLQPGAVGEESAELMALHSSADAGAQGAASVATARLPPQVANMQSVITQAITDMKTKALVHGAFTKDLAASASKLLPSASKYITQMEAVSVERVRAERNIESVLDLYADLPAGERGTRGSVNTFLKDSTMQKKWGYAPDYAPNVTVDPDMERRFKAMSAQGRELIQGVFRHGHESLLQLKGAVTDNVTSEFDIHIRELERTGDLAGAKKAREDKLRALAEYRNLDALRGDWPYAPLKRFGNHVVVGMSQAYLDAEQGRDAALMDKLKEDGNHYYVAFRDTRGEARKLKAEVENRFAYSDNFEKDDAHNQLYGGRDVLGAFRRLRDLVASSQDEHLAGQSSKALNRMMVDLQLTLLGEQSARQAERNRRGVAGADDDMMRAFATQGRAMAHFVASLKSNGKIQDEVNAMKGEADARTPGREQRRDMFNELLKRHVMGMDYKPSPGIDRALSVTSFWMLLTSPAYYLTNAMQPFVMSLPSMAGRHGYAKSVAALMQAYTEVLPLVKSGSIQQEDYSKLPADVRAAVQQLVDGGSIDISLEQDLGRWRSEGDEGLKAVVPRVLNKLRGMTQTVESVNRLTTAMAAVRLERGSGSGNEVKYAAKVIYDTHGDYSGFNAPRLMRTNVGRLMTQFRKFQLIQLSLYAKLAHESFKGASADERLVARKTLAFNLTHMFALGGLLGMPAAQTVSMVLGMAFGDEDEPNDAEQTLRKLAGDGPLADILTKGVPKALGLDLSGRVGAGNMLSVQAYASGEVSREGYAEYAVAMLGPFLGGLMPKVADGLALMAKGQHWQGLEQLLPKGFADASKSIRFGVEGVSNRRGDTLMAPDDVTWSAHVGQLLGLPTTQITDRGARASAAYKSDKFYTERASAVKAQYIQAYRSNDVGDMQEARAAWRSLQEARKRYGYKVQPLSDLLRAPRAQADRERNTVDGVQFNRANRGMVQSLTGG